MIAKTTNFYVMWSFYIYDALYMDKPKMKLCTREVN